MIDIENAKKVFHEYVNGYDSSDGKIALKINHILRVSEISKRIATELNLSEEDIELAELIGLLHDIGRFEQVRVYHTFRDKDSINHGEYGVKVLFEDGLIDRFNIDEKFYDIIKKSILNHNRARIEEGLNEREILHSKIIRDSDKLDIYYVLISDDTINTYSCEHMENETFSDDIINDFHEHHLINYGNIKTKGDHWVCHMAYIFDLYFKSSYHIIKENRYLERLFEKMNFQDEKTKKQAEDILSASNLFVDEQMIQVL